jgi:hypothetical protein
MLLFQPDTCYYWLDTEDVTKSGAIKDREINKISSLPNMGYDVQI